MRRLRGLLRVLQAGCPLGKCALLQGPHAPQAGACSFNTLHIFPCIQTPGYQRPVLRWTGLWKGELDKRWGVRRIPDARDTRGEFPGGGRPRWGCGWRRQA